MGIMNEFNHLPIVDPWMGAIRRFDVASPTDKMREEHRAEVAKITGEDPDERVVLIGSVEAGLPDSGVETFDVEPPTEEMLAEHRAVVAGIVGSETVKLSKAGIVWAAIKAATKGRVI